MGGRTTGDGRAGNERQGLSCAEVEIPRPLVGDVSEYRGYCRGASKGREVIQTGGRDPFWIAQNMKRPQWRPQVGAARDVPG